MNIDQIKEEFIQKLKIAVKSVYEEKIKNDEDVYCIGIWTPQDPCSTVICYNTYSYYLEQYIYWLKKDKMFLKLFSRTLHRFLIAIDYDENSNNAPTLNYPNLCHFLT